MDAGFWGAMFQAAGKVATTPVKMIGDGAGQMNGTTEAVFDNSGWNVNFDGSLTSSAQKTIDQGTTASGAPTGQPLAGYLPASGGGLVLTSNTLLYGAAFAVILLLIRHKKG